MLSALSPYNAAPEWQAGSDEPTQRDLGGLSIRGACSKVVGRCEQRDGSHVLKPNCRRYWCQG